MTRDDILTPLAVAIIALFVVLALALVIGNQQTIIDQQDQIITNQEMIHEIMSQVSIDGRRGIVEMRKLAEVCLAG